MDKKVQIILKQLLLQIHAADLWTPETIRVYQIFSSISEMEIKSNKRKMLGSDRISCSKEDLLESERRLVCSPESETEQKQINPGGFQTNIMKQEDKMELLLRED